MHRRSPGPFAIEYPGVAANISLGERKIFYPLSGNKASFACVYSKVEAPVPSVPPTFEQLMLPHMDAAYNLARWLLRDPHDAEDAVQEASLRAFRAIGSFGGGDGRPWLLAIVRNVCYSHLRKNRREPEAEPFDDEAHGYTYDPAEANAVAWSELKSELLRRALERLSAEFREAIADHIRSLQFSHLSDVVSTDRHTVKPWFAGKLDFSPPVADLAALGFPLTGGRLEHLDDRPAAALVFRRRLHAINVFIWPAARGTVSNRHAERNGYRAQSWSQGGFNFLAVSEISTVELNQFVAAFKSADSD